MPVRIKLNSAGIRGLLRSTEMEAHLRARAERIAAAAGPGFEASSMVGRNRARASVITTSVDAILAESRSRTLSRSIDAGR